MDQNLVVSTVDSLFVAFRDFERWEEPGIISEDFTRARWGWGNWQQLPDPVVIKNSSWIDNGNLGIDFNSGVITFQTPLSGGDEVRASYRMRLYPLSLISQFIPIVMSEINLKKPQSNYDIGTSPDRYFSTMVMGIYIRMLEALLLKLGMYKWRRLFENVASIETQMRANLEDARADYQTLLATTKRRGDCLPGAVASWNVGRAGLFMVDNINFQDLVISR